MISFPSGAGLGRHRLILTITAAAVLVVAGLLLGIYDTVVYRAQAFRQADVQAKILAASVVGSLAFKDSEVAQQYVNALGENPSIAAAAVYDDAGNTVASYSRESGALVPTKAPVNGEVSAGAYIKIARPVIEKEKMLGTVYVSELTDPLVRRLLRYGSIGLLVMLGTLVVVVLSQMNRELGNSNAQLRNEMQEREKAESALRQSQKMEAIGQLTGGIAHDFNNMLAIVIGGIELARRRAVRGETNIDQFLDGALDGARRAATLTQRLLAFSRRQPLRPEPVEINRLVGDMSELLRRTIGELYSFATILAAGIWHIEVDAHQLENVILNLVVNSRDAMPDGGKVTISTANCHLSDLDAGKVGVAAGQYVLIEVADTGCGMPPDILAKAFDPFFTTKGVGRGTGLGLSQVYGFIDQSGGQVKIRSAVGMGTTVSIYLPRYMGSAELQVPHVAATRVPQGSDDVTILVVEDEESVRQFVTHALGDLGFRTLSADNGHVALALLKQHKEIGVLFTDVVMPEMNGPQLADEARKLRPDLRVLFTTGYARETAGLGGIISPNIRVLGKPFTYEQLGAAFRDLLAESPRTFAQNTH